MKVKSVKRMKKLLRAANKDNTEAILFIRKKSKNPRYSYMLTQARKELRND